MFKLVPALRPRIRDSVEAMRADVAGALLQRWSGEWRPDFVARIRALRERQLPTLSDTDLDAHLAEVMKLVDDGHDVHFRLHGALAMVLGDLAFTCRDLLGWDETHIFSLLGGTSTTSTEPARALADLAALAGPQVRALLKQAAPANKVLAADEKFGVRVRRLPTRLRLPHICKSSLIRRWRSGPTGCSGFCVTNWTAVWTPRDSKSSPSGGMPPLTRRAHHLTALTCSGSSGLSGAR